MADGRRRKPLPGDLYILTHRELVDTVEDVIDDSDTLALDDEGDRKVLVEKLVQALVQQAEKV